MSQNDVDSDVDSFFEKIIDDEDRLEKTRNFMSDKVYDFSQSFINLRFNV